MNTFGGVQLKRGRPRGEISPKADLPPTIVGRQGLYNWAKTPTYNWIGQAVKNHIEQINWCLENCMSFQGIEVGHSWNSYRTLKPIFKNVSEETFYALRWPNKDDNNERN